MKISNLICERADMAAVENIITILEDYISKAEEDEFFRDHDSRFVGLRAAVKEKSAKLKPPLNVIAPRLYYIADHSFYCIELFKYKYYLLAKAMLHGFNELNPLSLANNCRSLLEQVATLAYCMQAVQTMLDGLKDQGSIEKIDVIISKAEKILQRTYAGEGKKKNSASQIEAIHVHTAIEDLDKKLADSINSYDYLCEFVHPNLGNNLLVSSGEIGKGKIHSRSNMDENIVKIASIGIALLVFNTESVGMAYPTLTWRTHHLVELCFTRGAKITNVFSTKKPLPEGDGRSKETAFFFKNARTAQESMSLSYQYLIDNGHSVEPYNRSNGGVATIDCTIYIYDKWKTKVGDIWFKTPAYAGI